MVWKDGRYDDKDRHSGEDGEGHLVVVKSIFLLNGKDKGNQVKKEPEEIGDHKHRKKGDCPVDRGGQDMPSGGGGNML